MNNDITQSIDIDYGPLTGLIGTWRGDKGKDLSPEQVGSEENHYRETLCFEPIGLISNAEEQELVGLEYHQSVVRINDNKLLHSECGYVMWDPVNQQVVKTLSIPRGIALIAGGKLLNTKQEQSSLLEFKVIAAIDHPEWHIIESPFMRQKASTKSYEFYLHLKGDQLKYSQTMQLAIFDREFNHVDSNNLIRE